MAEAEMAQGWGGWGWDGNFSSWPGGLCSGGSLSRGLCPGGGVFLWWSLSGGLCLGASVQGGLCPGGLCVGVSVQGCLCPGGSLSMVGLCPWGSLSGGLCPGGSLSGGLCPGDLDPLYGNKRAVRILLECILVDFIFLLSECLCTVHFWIRCRTLGGKRHGIQVTNLYVYFLKLV